MDKTDGQFGKIGVVVAARLGSTRLPGKALRTLFDRPMILFLLDRIKEAELVDEIILATTTLEEDDLLAKTVEKAGYKVFRGANEDVVERYVSVADAYDLDYVVRVTGDCPFVNAEALDYCLRKVQELESFSLATTKGHFPVGIDFEIYKHSDMVQLHNHEKLTDDHREHLTLFMYSDAFDGVIYKIDPPNTWRSSKEFTVDTFEDWEVANKIANSFSSIYFSISDLVGLDTNES
jgi:spore coat polysaccharide biosynthesis protein SpsF